MLTIVNYAVNGTGLGHVARLVAINRWIRRIANQLGDRVEIYFLTSSEASHVLHLEQFVSLKLSAANVAEQAGLERSVYRRFAGKWVKRGIDLLRPDLMIVDSFPKGEFGELPDALRACHWKAFVYRPMKQAFAEQSWFQSALLKYDAILVPEREGRATVEVPPAVRGRLRYIGPVIMRERDEILPRFAAREQLAIGNDRLAIYVSAGGAGGSRHEELLQSISNRLRKLPDVHLVIGAGPLGGRTTLAGPNLTWVTRPAICEFMAAFDVAISAAGYNSFVELMHFGVPTVFLPRPGPVDDQDARAHQAVIAGAAVCLDQGDLSGIEDAVERWRSAALRQAASDAARSVVPVNCARNFATHLLELARKDPRRPSLGARIKTALPQPVREMIRSVRSRLRH